MPHAGIGRVRALEGYAKPFGREWLPVVFQAHGLGFQRQARAVPAYLKGGKRKLAADRHLRRAIAEALLPVVFQPQQPGGQHRNPVTIAHHNRAWLRQGSERPQISKFHQHPALFLD